VVWGHSRSLLAMTPFDRAHTTSYLTVIETASILYRFPVIASYLLRITDFNLFKVHFSSPFKFHWDLFLQRKLEFLGYRVATIASF